LSAFKQSSETKAVVEDAVWLKKPQHSIKWTWYAV